MSFGRGGLDIGLKRTRYPLNERVGNAFLPVQAIVPLGREADDQARCLVFPGDRVEECQIIGRADRREASNIHSPIPGTVSEIRSIRNPAGHIIQAVVVELGGSFSVLGRKPENFPWRSLSAADIIHLITEKGVLRLGKEAKPMQQVILDARKSGEPWFILSCIDTEPHVASESLALAERAHAIAEGLEILFKAASAGAAVIIYSPSQSAAVERLLEEISSRGIKHVPLMVQDRYPQGFPSQLRSVAKSLEPRLIPAGLMEAAHIIDSSSLIAVRDAVAGNKPFIERYITVAGDAIKQPRILKVRIGMKIGDIIEECGGFRGVPERIVLDGPMTGHAITDLDIPVGKTNSAIVALSKQEINESRRTSCVRCGRCVDVCPEALDPQRLYSLCVLDPESRALSAALSSCSSCGLCAYICPSRLPLLEAFRRTMLGHEQRGARRC